MASTREIRRRIRSIKNTAQITKAMQMVASSKMRRAQDRVQQARPYAEQIRALVSRLANAAGEDIGEDVELLKQGQYQPLAVEKQVMIIYAANQGYLDDVPLDKVAAWEAAFHRFMEANHPEIGQEIVEKSVNGKEKMSKDLLNKLNAAIEEFKQTAAPD